MKAQAISSFGDCSVFETIELPKPTVKPGYVLIRVEATSVNPVDCKVRSGKYSQISPPFPAILHSDVSGIIEEVGPNVTEFSVGDEVYGCAGGFKDESGALAEYMLVDARLIAKKPKTLSMVEAAALPLVTITAWEALFEKIKIKPGQKVLIHAGIGGVGHIAIQLAKWAGAEVYTTVSSQNKAEIAKSLGAKEAINYRDESVQEYVGRLTSGVGFDVVFDTVGGDNLNQSLAAVALYGNVISIQSAALYDLSPLHAKSASLHAVFMLIPLLHNVQRERHGMILKQIASLVDEGYLKPLIDPHLFYFENIDKAHALLESGKAMGKVVVQAY
ncbi:zinc-dependent alcohol dehydrogenase family protein [Legionella longbeachae]|uniref:Quinone oxidoreductase (NADPH:quinone reductase) n=1 Tax=Legionella longbeachae serogroup 1 (strain NSW150) TaxID=661367 RepID=D3HQG3_LEGLN|nr:zinc-dependent alcohol dehydrogenase family protein [Legionella longbeachae]VEE01650.1 Quinone oxidoreductase (NADPH:quinone reductase) [Legionella oakridgensis]HBD7396409.1 zinc-dependent alcohol dehydrogenase family protein [Legionella pneumophila]ARB92011.1 quinone oxidoreductase [Legionella longbeachae]ARM34803.1 zinc-dependent alcohol dehydrogenase family protein [Legionella longbeachae]EEZ95756.1 quinone oxidoreductase [Legionella longbeachae D-4968]